MCQKEGGRKKALCCGSLATSADAPVEAPRVARHAASTCQYGCGGHYFSFPRLISRRKKFYELGKANHAVRGNQMLIVCWRRVEATSKMPLKDASFSP